MTEGSSPHAGPVVRIADEAVDPAFDRELRHLLAGCFTKPGDEIFESRRHFEVPPSWRWSVRSGDRLIAHAAAHDFGIEFAAGCFRILGIAEVCVEPDFRGRGLVRRMLDAAHDFGVERGFDFAMLFGRPEIYRSCGYRAPSGTVLVEGPDGRGRFREDALMRPLAIDVPIGDSELRGPAF